MLSTNTSLHVNNSSFMMRVAAQLFLLQSNIICTISLLDSKSFAYFRYISMVDVESMLVWPTGS